MKKLLTSIGKIFGKIFKFLYKIIDVIIVVPLSKFFYFIADKLGSKNGSLDKFLNNPNTLIYLSLFFAFLIFFAVDNGVVNLTGSESTVLTKIPITVDYNEEEYVVEGIPETADIVLMGKKSGLYLAEQLVDEHKLTLDLSGYTSGTHKVKLKYNNPVKLDYKLDPSKITLVIHSKISESRTITADILNKDKLNETLVISSVKLDRDTVIIKSYKEKLEKVASVKALVDVNALNINDKPGEYKLENVKLVAYDEMGTEITNIEIVPGTVTATVTVTSPSKVVPVKVVPVGDVASGSAIGSISSNVSTVTLYGDEETLKSIDEIKVNINVDGLSKDKTYQETIEKPNGVRSMSNTNITIKVVMEKETSKEFKDIPLTFENLDTNKYRALASSASDTKVNVVVKGVKTLLDKLSSDNIRAYVDLSDLTEGEYEVPVMVTGDDVKLSYSSRTTKIKVIINKK